MKKNFFRAFADFVYNKKFHLSFSMKKIILLSTFFISVFPVALDAYEFTPKDSEILSVILRRANDAIIKK